MNRATQQMRDFAERLMANEAGENKSHGVNILQVVHVCETLRLHLAAFMGSTGFHTLLARALALAAMEVSWLRAVRVNLDGSLEGWEELQAQLHSDEVLEGGVVLLAQLLGLLVAFIGENLTVRLVREIWPKVPLDDLDFGNAARNGAGGQNEYRGKNEKTR